MDIEVVTDYNSFLSLESLWDDLLSKSSSDMICLTHDWFKCWWHTLGKEYEDNQNLFVLLIKDKGEYIGIIPLKTSRVKYRGFKIKKIGFIESEISPHLDFILTSKREESIREVINFLKGQKLWDILVLRKFEEDSENYRLLKKILEEENTTIGIKPGLPDPIIQIDGDWDNFFSGRSVKFRKSLRNKINKAEKFGQLKVEKISEVDNIRKSLPLIFDISKRSWKSKIGQALPDNKMDIDFYTDLTDKLGKKGWINIWLLKNEDKPIAFEYHMKHNGIVYPIRADFDEAYRQLSPGSILEYNIIKSLFEDREVKEYDSCGNDYKYLQNWTDILKNHVNIHIFSPKTYSQFLYFFEYKIVSYLRRRRLLRYAINHLNKKV